jgi:hypothetical protein
MFTVLGGSYQILRIIQFQFSLQSLWEPDEFLKIIFFTVTENQTGYQVFFNFHFVQFSNIVILTNKITTDCQTQLSQSHHLMQNARK